MHVMHVLHVHVTLRPAKTRQQPEQDDERRQRDQKHEEQAEADEDVVATVRWHPRPGVTLQQRHVAQVGLPEDIADVAEDRHEPHQHVEPGVHDHPHHDDRRHAHAETGYQHECGVDRGGQIAKARHQAENRIDAEPEVGARHAERAVEQHGPSTQEIQPGGLVRLMHVFDP